MDDPHHDERPAPRTPAAADARPPIQHCPFCGESIGSFWGRRGDEDGTSWCEGCQTFFRVELA